jgi:UDP:flavonoid glycosyltransferase YjiC (YdhE family)
VIGLFPDWYGMPQADWPAQLRLAGFPLFDGQPEEELDPALQDFCSAGEPPIAFTLGTGNVHAAEFFRAAVEACRLLNRRGIFLTQFPQQLPQPLPPQIRHCAFAPFLKLFPRCAAVVHHGGIGTSAKALTAGTPQLILPLAFDQMDNARRLRDLGVGTSLKANRRGAADLARALSELLQPQVQTHCKAVATRHVHGVEWDALDTAAQWIEDVGVRPSDCTLPAEA